MARIPTALVHFLFTHPVLVPAMASIEPHAQSLVERIQDFVSENKRALLIGTAAAVIAVGGIAYYASTSGGLGGENGDAEKAVRKGKGKRKGSKSSKKRKTATDKDTPILEEIPRHEAGQFAVYKTCLELSLSCTR
jgi:hypothetical protein